jgi:hypothetical protein
MKKISLFILVTVLGLMSCKKFLDVGDPKTLIPSSVVFSNDATAQSAMAGIYSTLVNSNGFAAGGSNSVTLMAGLSSDEFQNRTASGFYTAYFTNSVSADNSNSILWSDPYNIINNVNSLLDGLQKSSTVSTATKNQLTGEAKFVRAFCYFYLVNLFGDVPLITTSDYRQSMSIGRTIKSDVYTQIITDLKDAKGLLKSDYSASNGKRLVPNASAASALLARVYLYTGDWADAEQEATNVIGNSQYQLEPDLLNVFLTSSKEAIWQLMGTPTVNTPPDPTNFPTWASLSSSQLNAFEPSDKRRTAWVDSSIISGSLVYYPGKYKSRTAVSTPIEYPVVLRLAEQYLIRAEAEARQDKIGAAQSDLNAVRTRAGLGGTTASDKNSLLDAILRERRVELFSEWGHRWFDLKRTQTIDAVMTVANPQKGGSGWQSYQQLYPVPTSELITNKNLRQNPGY